MEVVRFSETSVNFYLTARSDVPEESAPFILAAVRTPSAAALAVQLIQRRIRGRSLNGFVGKRSWPNSKYYPDTFLEGPRKSTFNLMRTVGVRVEAASTRVTEEDQETDDNMLTDVSQSLCSLACSTIVHPWRTHVYFTDLVTETRQYVAAKWISLLLRILEFPASNLAPVTGCTETRPRSSRFLQGNVGPVTQIKPRLVTGFFNWPNPSSRTTAPGSTQPLTEMSTRNLPGG
jgi:hypothetical protein